MPRKLFKTPVILGLVRMQNLRAAEDSGKLAQFVSLTSKFSAPSRFLQQLKNAQKHSSSENFNFLAFYCAKMFWSSYFVSETTTNCGAGPQ